MNIHIWVWKYTYKSAKSALPTTLWLTLVVGVIHVIGIGNPKISVKTVGGRQNLLVMPKMPLAKTSGGIA